MISTVLSVNEEQGEIKGSVRELEFRESEDFAEQGPMPVRLTRSLLTAKSQSLVLILGEGV